jgi:hypothetical protein
VVDSERERSTLRVKGFGRGSRLGYRAAVGSIVRVITDGLLRSSVRRSFRSAIRRRIATSSAPSAPSAPPSCSIADVSWSADSTSPNHLTDDLI